MESTVLLKKTRKTVLLLLFLGWAIGNLDRYLINYAVVDIANDLALTATQTGVVLSSFFLGYAIMQMPGGLLADKYGAKKILLTAVIIWSIFTGLTAVAWSFSALIVIRFLFGIGEGGFQPAASKIIATIFPKNERSRAMSLLLASAAIMAMLVPLISAVLLGLIGWRLLFVITGLIGAVIAFLYWRYIQVPDTTVEAARGLSVTGENKGILKKLITMPFMWSLLVSYFTIYAVNWGLSSWMPSYLTNERGLDLLSIGYLQLIPGVLMLSGMLIFGIVIDKLTLQQNKVIGAVFAVGIAGFLFLMFHSNSIGMFIFHQCIVTILMTYITLLLPSFVLKTIPQDITATAMGMANTGGQLAGFITPAAMGFMVDFFNGSYNAAFWLLIIFAMICIFALLSIKSNLKEERVSNV
ncbi:MFS transporter [Brochothrix thermosphacta]|uniref:MFS transporter n=1 Tax=Brochothrix thermosphacta TaxID=2756 RepID=UPI0027130009|nr:MFS transporter [Brochothrix thermosphacta]MDO7863320.1 MFS transporter [Brochothrix thermosphacta]